MNEIKVDRIHGFSVVNSSERDSSSKEKVKKSAVSHLFESKNNRIKKEGFTDAFTQVASDQQNSVERLVMKVEGRSFAHNVSLSKGLNLIERIFGRIFNTKAYREYLLQNQCTVAAFRHFLIEEYGKEKIDQVSYQFRSKKIDLELLIRDKLPLTKEIVHLYNIGVNNIEQQDVDRLAEKLVGFMKGFTGDVKESLEVALLDNREFTVREIRGILHKMQESCEGREPTVWDLKEHFLSKLDTVEGFNDLVAILMPQGEEFLTGRKIQQPITGHNFNASLFSTTFQPWVDQQELLQVFQDLQGAENWKAYFEILSKIVVKKHLIREDQQALVRVGALIPAPKNKGGGWYRVEEALSSGRGKMVYTLVPAHSGYDEEMPIIRLYRNTTPSPYAMDAGPTITRDLNPDVPPGYLYSTVTLEQDQAFFDQFIANNTHELKEAGGRRHLALVGDSLGGADAQIDLCRFFVHADQLPNRNIDLYAFSSPAIKREDVDQFAKYILRHAKTLNAHSLSFNIQYRVDEEDFVPTRLTYDHGKVAKHLGYGLYLPDNPLKAKVVVHRKLSKRQESLERVAHLRMYANTQKGVDYSKEQVSVREFDDRFKTESRIIRFLRNRFFCALSEKIWKIWRFFFGRLMVYAADTQGIIYAHYQL